MSETSTPSSRGEILLDREGLIADERLMREIGNRIDRLVKGKVKPEEVDLNNEFWGFMEGHPSTLVDGEGLSHKNVGKNVLEYALQRLADLHLSCNEREGRKTPLFDLFAGDYRSMEIILTNDNENTFLPHEDDLKTPARRRRWMLVEDVEEHGEKKRKVYIQIRNEGSYGSDMIEMMTFLGVLHLVRKASFGEINEFFANKTKKPSFLNSQEDFERWKNRKILVNVDFDQKRPSAISLLVNEIEKHNFSEPPPVLLIGNDFFLRLLVFSLVLSKEDENKLASIFSEGVNNLRRLFKEKQIPQDLQPIIEKYYLLSRLNLYSQVEDENIRGELERIYKKVFFPDNYRRLGFTRLLDGVRKTDGAAKSPTAEPVDLWDPSKISDEIITDETSLIQQLINGLKDRKVRILSVPYLIGDLSKTLIEELLKKNLINRNVIGFVGKVGCATNETDQVKLSSKIGAQVSIGEKVFYIDDQSREPLLTSYQGEIPVMQIPFLTVPAVLVQTAEAIKRVLSQLKGGSENEPNSLALDMEMHHVLSLLSEMKILLASAFYVSDLSPIDISDSGIAERITVPINKEVGAIAVVLAMIRVLEQIAPPVPQAETKVE